VQKHAIFLLHFCIVRENGPFWARKPLKRKNVKEKNLARSPALKKGTLKKIRSKNWLDAPPRKSTFFRKNRVLRGGASSNNTFCTLKDEKL